MGFLGHSIKNYRTCLTLRSSDSQGSHQTPLIGHQLYVMCSDTAEIGGILLRYLVPMTTKGPPVLLCTDLSAGGVVVALVYGKDLLMDGRCFRRGLHGDIDKMTTNHSECAEIQQV